MTTNANSLEHIEQKSAALCFSCFFHYIPYKYIYVLYLLKLHTYYSGGINLTAFLHSRFHRIKILSFLA